MMGRNPLRVRGLGAPRSGILRAPNDAHLASPPRNVAPRVLQRAELAIDHARDADPHRDHGRSVRRRGRFLKDKFGLSWQIVSPDWNDMLRDKDPARAERVMEAILTMTKPDLATIRRAYERPP